VKEIKVGDLIIQPNFDREVVDVHPSIGVADDAAYVGVWIPCTVDGEKRYKAYKDLLYLVTEKRMLVLANEEVFGPKSWRLSYKPIKFPNRWNVRYVNSYLNSETHLNPTLNPREVFQRVLDTWIKYIEFTDQREHLYQSLWTIGTYFHHLFNTFPYNYFTGLKRTGKTKCLTLLSCLCFNAFFSNNMSTSSIYRLIQNAKGTLLIDETEKLSNPYRAQDFRSILLNGYKKGALVYRVEKSGKERLVPEAFEVYAPKGLANIGGVEDVLEDRCKVTVLRRSINRKITDKLVDLNSDHWSDLRNNLYYLYLSYWREIQGEYQRLRERSERNELVNFLAEQDIPLEDLKHLSSRELELWEPILALAEFFDKHGCSSTIFTSTQHSQRSLRGTMTALACESAKQRRVENLTETGEEILIQTLVGMVVDDSFYKVKHIKEEMVSCFDEEQKWITARWIGSALRRLGFKEKRRLGTGYEYKFIVTDVVDLAERMGVELPQKKSQGVPEEGVEGSSQDETASDKRLRRLTEGKTLNVAEIAEQLRHFFPRKFIEHDLVKHAVQLGLSEDQALQLFSRLRGSRILRDPDGYWQWV
jgi:hypothetical protein